MRTTGAHSIAVVLAVLIIALWVYALTAGGLMQHDAAAMTGLAAVANMLLVVTCIFAAVRQRAKTSVVLALLAFFPVGFYLLMNPFPLFLLGAMELALVGAMIFAWWNTRKGPQA